MSTQRASEDDILRPIQRTTRTYFIMFAVAAAGAGIFLVAWSYQLYHGLIVTGLSDWGSGGGSTWGVYIGAFIWWVGIAHGGIILSAAVRLLGMDRYKPVARMAELLTIAALSMAGLYIFVHVGRVDRVVWSIVLNYHQTVHSSPLVWDVTVITLYMVLTATYLGLTLRYDVSRLRDDLPGHFEPFYKVLTIGYTPEEDPVVERMVWWLALAIIILAPLLLHGGVIPWLFALLPNFPGWFGGVQGPQFLTIALSSAISGVIIMSLVFRRAYDWYHILTDDVVRGLTLWLGFFVLLFVWLQLQQIITGVFSPTVGMEQAIVAKITSPVYQFAMTLVIISLAYIFAQAVKPHLWTPVRALGASLLVLVGTLTEKTFFVVEGLTHPGFTLYAAIPGSYVPSPVELASLVGTVSLACIFFLVVTKVFPVVELHAVEELQEKHDARHPDGGES